MINTYDLHISQPERFNQLEVKDMLFVYYRCPQVERQLQLFTHFNEIAYTLSGKKTIYQGGKSWELTENKSLFFRRAAYKQELDETAGWEVLAFYFKDDFLRKVFDEYKNHLPLKNLPVPPKEMFIEINVNESARAFFFSILPYFNQKHYPPKNLLELKFKELLFNFLSDPTNSAMLAYVNSIMDQYKTPIWEIMENNYTFNLTIGQFAKMAERSTASFKREFYKYYKTTPGKWLHKKRLVHARLSLEISNDPIAEIAFDSGFKNVSHFSRIFKENYGLSPSIYREKAKKT
ncbi:helix-turn-helix domain-containing protein [Cyclobacterium plantarum]|uniref:helix-turn-helix domain-containing protein n=1 Tax=Cyclobacterium plantarum TaxID=2716263 RepID=UPI003F71213F